MLNTVLKGGLLMPHWHVVDDSFLLQNYEWEYFVCENDCTFISNTHRGVQFFQKILSEVLMSKILPKVAQLSCKKCLQKYQHRLFFYLSFLLPSHAVLWRLPWWWLHHFFQQFCNAFHCLWDLSSFAHQDLQFSLRSIFHLFCCSISNATLSYSELQI